jgi:hypothetical protein
MRRVPLLCTLPMIVLSVVACKKAPSSPATVRGETFSLPVPGGYLVVTDPAFTKMAPGGVMLRAVARATEGAFVGSVVVTRIPMGPPLDQSSDEACKKLGAALTTGMPVQLKRTVLAQTAAGKSCQYEVIDNQVATRGAQGTVMSKTRENSWLVTCNFDIKDAAARTACQAVLDGWRFD